MQGQVFKSREQRTLSHGTSSLHHTDSWINGEINAVIISYAYVYYLRKFPLWVMLLN